MYHATSKRYLYVTDQYCASSSLGPCGVHWDHVAHKPDKPAAKLHISSYYFLGVLEFFVIKRLTIRVQTLQLETQHLKTLTRQSWALPLTNMKHTSHANKCLIPLTGWRHVYKGKSQLTCYRRPPACLPHTRRRSAPWAGRQCGRRGGSHSPPSVSPLLGWQSLSGEL